MNIAIEARLPLADMVAQYGCEIVRNKLELKGYGINTLLDITVFDRSGRLIGHANG